MGTQAQANGHIEFTNETTAKFSYKLIENWVDKANAGDFPKDSPDNGDYEIYDVTLVDSWIKFNAFSGRDVNLTWQMERFREFCKTLPDCISFSANIMVVGDGVYWEKNND